MVCANAGGNRFLRSIIFCHSTRRHIQNDINFSWYSCWCFSFVSSEYMFISFPARLSGLQDFAHTITWIWYIVFFVINVSHTQFLQILFKLLVWSSLYLRLAMRVYIVRPRLRHYKRRSENMFTKLLFWVIDYHLQ